MKLDLDLTRDILLEIEREHQAPGWELAISSESYPRFYAAKKLTEQGFVRSHRLADADDDEVEWITIEEMTAAGHEFLESIRDPRAWKAAKAAASKIGNSGFGILMDIAQSYAKTKLGL
jgi:hypothetical protein